jgi:Holliday junction resolvase-like predicted endonuclease
MKPTRLEDWPHAVRKQIEKQLEGERVRGREACAATCSDGASGKKHGTGLTRSPSPRTRPGAQTESEALALLKSIGMTFVDAQAPFTLAGGHIYTADLVMAGVDCKLYMVEVKGTYRHETEDRSRVAFDQARITYRYGGLWMKKCKARPGRAARWQIEVF